jgi:hypothetical protein
MRNILKVDLGHLMFFAAPVFVLFIYLFRYSPVLQFQVLSLSVMVYLLIALSHHHHTKTLSLEIIVEYILISGLTLIILQGFLV